LRTPSGWVSCSVDKPRELRSSTKEGRAVMVGKEESSSKGRRTKSAHWSGV
jgi:hypothetical protein